MTTRNHVDIRVNEGNNAVDFSYQEGVGSVPTVYVKSKNSQIAIPAKEFEKAAKILVGAIDGNVISCR